MKILVIGGTSYDSIIHLNNLPDSTPNTLFASNFFETVGSTGTGKALNIQKLGFDVKLHSVIGDDLYGEIIKDYFKEQNIHFIYDTEGNTERHTNLMDPNGNRLSIYTVPSTFNPKINMEKLEESIKTCDIVVLNIINYTRHLIPIIKKYNKLLLTDLHDYDGKNPYHKEYLDASDIVFLSSDKLPDYKNWMMNQNKQLIVCTHGKDGVTAMDENKNIYHETIISKFNVIDTNGAGDSFFSGFLYGYLLNKPIQDCLKLGTICGGLCVESKELVNNHLSETYLHELYDTFYKEEK